MRTGRSVPVPRWRGRSWPCCCCSPAAPPFSTSCPARAQRRSPAPDAHRQTEEDAMTWGVITDVPAPMEMYDAVHAEVLHRAGTTVEGLLVHIARPTAEGF